MKRSELEHLIRAAGAVANEDRLVIIGSQAILGQFPNAAGLLCQSMEADMIPIDHPEKWNLIDGVLGQGSPFHETFGYYADGVDESTAILPQGWQQRLVPLVNENTRGVLGLCLEVHDLLITKYCAGREKDLAFTATAVASGMVEKEHLLDLLCGTNLTTLHRELIRKRIEADFARDYS
ncbi:MAG: DUF6036 family nucleotidyltransferase [Methylococcales bacterium]